MLEFLDTLGTWYANNHKIAMARVIKAKGSSPRPVGSMMFINSEGQMMGSVSGGCIEGEMVKHAFQLFEGAESRQLGFGIADEDAWAVGLPCGGALHTFIQMIDMSEPTWSNLAINLRSNIPCALITSLEDNGCTNILLTLSNDEQFEDVRELKTEVEKAFRERSHKLVEKGGIDYFIQIFPRKSLLLAIGAAHITADLVAFGNKFDFETVVIDPRGYFSQYTIFDSPPNHIITEYPSEVLHQFPLDNYTYCAILSHDPKIDDDGIEFLLKTDVAYIGALGSKQRHERRKQKLLQKGFTKEQADRIHGPIGLSIHSVTSKEIALSIMGEIIQVKNEHLFRNIKS